MIKLPKGKTTRKYRPGHYTRKSRWSRPAPVRGEPMPMPENEGNRLGQWIEAFMKRKINATRIDLSNGEFIANSVILAKTEDAMQFETSNLELEVASYTYHYDDKLKLYWRWGGSFD